MDQAQGYADERMEIADGPAETVVEVQDKRVRIDTRKWTLSKLLPKTYGDKLDVSADTNLTIRVIREDAVSNGQKTLSDGGKHGRTPAELESAAKPSHMIEAKSRNHKREQ